MSRASGRRLIDTWTGPLAITEAAIQILLIPATLAIGLAVMGLIAI
ncbi:MAG: hypothetical protein KIT81_01900 [Alphaproteobacteria bacterium]|nr:hypothetical protein [Alphaproteobacteria bacterium]